jgi:hypothetical protein
MSEINDRNLAVAKEIVALMNVMGNDRDVAVAIADELKNSHRTLQGSFWRTIKMTAGEYYEANKDFTDLRNKVAVDLAKDIEDSNNFPPLV